MSTRFGAPPAGVAAAAPRPDLRGYRLGVAALIARPMEQLQARRFHGLIGGFTAALAIALISVAASIPSELAFLLATTVNVAVALVLPTMLLSPTDRRLLGIVQRMTTDAVLAWRRAYGSAPIPRTEEQQLLWLAAQPTTTTDPDAVSIEGSMFLTLGRYADARGRAERLPDDKPVWRFDQALALAAIEFDAGTGPGDLTLARTALESVRGSRRAGVQATLALEEAARAMIRGDDWDPPIARAGEAAGSAVVAGVATTLGRFRQLLPWFLLSELALGTTLAMVR